MNGEQKVYREAGFLGAGTKFEVPPEGGPFPDLQSIIDEASRKAAMAGQSSRFASIMKSAKDTGLSETDLAMKLEVFIQDLDPILSGEETLRQTKLDIAESRAETAEERLGLVKERAARELELQLPAEEERSYLRTQRGAKLRAADIAEVKEVRAEETWQRGQELQPSIEEAKEDIDRAKIRKAESEDIATEKAKAELAELKSKRGMRKAAVVAAGVAGVQYAGQKGFAAGMRGVTKGLGVSVSPAPPSSVAPSVGKFYTAPRPAVPGAPMYEASRTPVRSAQAMLPVMSRAGAAIIPGASMPAATLMGPGAPMTGVGMDLSGLRRTGIDLSGLRSTQTRTPSVLSGPRPGTGMDLSRLREAQTRTPSVLSGSSPAGTLSPLRGMTVPTREPTTVPTREPMTELTRGPMAIPSSTLRVSEDSAPAEIRRTLKTGEQIGEPVDYPVLFKIGPKQGNELGKPGTVFIVRMVTGFSRFAGVGDRTGQVRSKLIGRKDPEEVAMKMRES